MDFPEHMQKVAQLFADDLVLGFAFGGEATTLSAEHDGERVLVEWHVYRPRRRPETQMIEVLANKPAYQEGLAAFEWRLALDCSRLVGAIDRRFGSNAC